MRAALADGGNSQDALWFVLDPLPEGRERAERYGNPEGARVPLYEESLRRRWLDLAQPEQRRDEGEESPDITR